VRQQIQKSRLGDQKAFQRPGMNTTEGAQAAQPKVQQRLQPIANGHGEVALRNPQGDTILATLKARNVSRSGQWRSEGFNVDKMALCSAKSTKGRAKPDPTGLGYFQSERGKSRVVTDR
jgi:hypothetical protein